jgi:hypothetical protein
MMIISTAATRQGTTIATVFDPSREPFVLAIVATAAVPVLLAEEVADDTSVDAAGVLNVVELVLELVLFDTSICMDC